MFEGNRSVHGGAINTGGGGNETVFINRSIFRGNSATERIGGSGNGGAIYISGGNLTVVNSVLSGNVANRRGAALYVENANAALLTNCTISGNFSGIEAAVYNIPAFKLALANNIIARNLSTTTVLDISEGGGINSAGGNMIGDQAGALSAFPLGSPNALADYVGNASIPMNPSFVSPTTSSLLSPSTAGDFHLLPNSLAINHGINSNYVIYGNFDVEGNDRLQSGIIDIGAYESPFAAIPTLSEWGFLILGLSLLILGLVYFKTSPFIARS